jgi:hypothetical protein
VPGEYKLIWDETSDSDEQVLSGPYLLHLQSEKSVSARKMTMIK